MDFKDWRKSTRPAAPTEAVKSNKYHGRRFTDYIEEQIQAAQERGAFDNLRGMGQPLELDDNSYAGDKALGYSLLKSNGYAPPEVELAGEIRQELERLAAERDKLARRGRDLRNRRISPFASEKRAYNHAVATALEKYTATVRDLNRKILTLNLTAPASMHRPLLDVEEMVQQFQGMCSPLTS